VAEEAVPVAVTPSWVKIANYGSTARGVDVLVLESELDMAREILDSDDDDQA
jgi:hypothetical protein